MLINKETGYEKMMKLAGVDNVINESKQRYSNVIETAETLEGKVYGVIKENNHYYIKVADKKESLNESDFDYIGGIMNRVDKKYSYSRVQDATRNMSLMTIAINERLGKDIEQDDFEDEDVFSQDDLDNTPEGGEDDFPADFGGAESEDESEGGDESSEEGDFEMADDTNSDDIDMYVGKLTASIRDSDNSALTSQKQKGIVNSVLSALPMENMNDDDKNDIIKRVKTGRKPVDEVEDMYAPKPINESVVENGNTFHKCHHILEAVMNGQKLVATEYFNSLRTPDFFFTYLTELDFNETMINGYREYLGSQVPVEDKEEEVVDTEVSVDEPVQDDTELKEEEVAGTVESDKDIEQRKKDSQLLMYFGYKLSNSSDFKRNYEVNNNNGAISINSDNFSLTTTIYNDNDIVVKMEDVVDDDRIFLRVNKEVYDEFASNFK